MVGRGGGREWRTASRGFTNFYPSDQVASDELTAKLELTEHALKMAELELQTMRSGDELCADVL